MLSHGVTVGPLHQPPLATYKLEDSLQWVHSLSRHMYHLTFFKLTCSGIFNNFRTTWELHFFDLPTPISLHFQFLLPLLTCSILLSFCLYCNLWQTSDSDYSHPQPWLTHGPNSPSYLGKLHITWKGFHENSWPQAHSLSPQHSLMVLLHSPKCFLLFSSSWNSYTPSSLLPSLLASNLDFQATGWMGNPSSFLH